jgi:hypothetical protein
MPLSNRSANQELGTRARDRARTRACACLSNPVTEAGDRATMLRASRSNPDASNALEHTLSSDYSAPAWLEIYLANFLCADDDWLEVGDGWFVYWQARLAQTTSLQVLDDGRLKWRVRTRIVEDVDDAVTANELCLGLNNYAAGWTPRTGASMP